MLEDLWERLGLGQTDDGEPDDAAFLADAMGPEPMYQPFDLDGDGMADGVQIRQAQDLNGDGIADAFFTEQQMDWNHDGAADAIQSQWIADSDFDGRPDCAAVSTAQDLDGDGRMDYAATAEDYDGDGQPDYVVTTGDFDGDGVFEAASVFEDLNGDGVLEPLNIDGAFDHYQPILDGSAPAYQTFDAANADPGDIVGDPAAAMENWHWQETPSSCAVASQEFVLEQLTGREFDEGALRELAEENGWYSPEGGTPIDDVGNLLEHMGMTVERSGTGSVQKIKNCLEHGGQVIAAVDSDELWHGTNDEAFGPGMDADHAVQVIGLDYSDPAQPMVILNDPGAANGGGATAPLDAFMDSWEDSGCFMVEAYA